MFVICLHSSNALSWVQSCPLLCCNVCVLIIMLNVFIWNPFHKSLQCIKKQASTKTLLHKTNTFTITLSSISSAPNLLSSSFFLFVYTSLHILPFLPLSLSLSLSTTTINLFYSFILYRFFSFISLSLSLSLSLSHFGSLSLSSPTSNILNCKTTNQCDKRWILFGGGREGGGERRRREEKGGCFV